MTENMAEEIEEIESWLDQVKNDEVGVEDYDFLKDAVTEGGTLGNVGSYLAVYEKNGDLYVDDELLEALDQKKTEIARQESENPSLIRERTNHREAVYGGLDGGQKSSIRSEEATIQKLREDGELEGGMLDGTFNRQGSGHGFIQNMIDDFKEAVPDYNEVSSSESEYTDKDRGTDTEMDQNQNQEQVLPSGGQVVPENKQHNQGGDNMTFDDKVDEFFDKTEELTEYMSDKVAESTRQTYENANDIQDKAMAIYRRADALSDAMRDREEVDNAVLDEGMEDLQDFYREAKGIKMTVDRAVETQQKTQYILHDRTELSESEKEFIEETQNAREILEERRDVNF